jgi:hypothetical protein
MSLKEALVKAFVVWRANVPSVLLQVEQPASRTCRANRLAPLERCSGPAVARQPEQAAR